MSDPLRCNYRPEPGQWPAQDCWSIFQTQEALKMHVEQFHPTHLEHTPGTPIITLGFTRQELDAMEERAWPSAIETWIHETVQERLGSKVNAQQLWEALSALTLCSREYIHHNGGHDNPEDCGCTDNLHTTIRKAEAALGQVERAKEHP